MTRAARHAIACQHPATPFPGAAAGQAADHSGWPRLGKGRSRAGRPGSGGRERSRSRLLFRPASRSGFRYGYPPTPETRHPANAQAAARVNLPADSQTDYGNARKTIVNDARRARSCVFNWWLGNWLCCCKGWLGAGSDVSVTGGRGHAREAAREAAGEAGGPRRAGAGRGEAAYGEAGGGCPPAGTAGAVAGARNGEAGGKPAGADGCRPGAFRCLGNSSHAGGPRRNPKAARRKGRIFRSGISRILLVPKAENG